LLTVKRHISNSYTKLGVKSRTQAIALGKELKLFE
jgi:ATP/maltotriose-dependent transcriptional regulator MalT